METSVKLMEPFSYSILPIVILSIIAIGMLIYFITDFIIKRCRQKEKLPVVRKLSGEAVIEIKKRYLKELQKIENDFRAQKISLRSAYQKMSKCIRKFVHEVTGIKVHNYTLEDIRMLNMPMLEELIKEYYVPEFSKQSSGDVKTSLEKTKRAIEKWN